MAQEAGQSRNALLDFRLTDCIGEAYVRICPMTAEVDAGRNRNARAFEYIAAKSFTVGAKSRAVGIDEESAIRCHRYSEAQFAERRNEKVAARPKRLPSLLDDGKRVRPEARQCGALRRRRRRDIKILGELLQVANVVFRRNEPTKAPSRHIEVFGKARDHERI